MSLEGWAADKLDAPRDGGHDGLQAFADCARLSGEVDDEGVVADTGGLSAEDRGRYFFE